MNNLNIDCVKGGKAKKAPYETTHARIPTEIKNAVEALSNSYKVLKQTDDSQGIEQLLTRVNQAITGNSVSNDSIPSEVEAKLNRLEQLESIITEYATKAIDTEKKPRYDQLNKLLAQINTIKG
jgi:hypothetical protein